MKKQLLACFSFAAVSCFVTCFVSEKGTTMICKVSSVKDIKKIFPTTVSEIEEEVEAAKRAVAAQVRNIVNIEVKNWQTVAEALDMISDVTTIAPILEATSYLNPSDELRNAAQKGSVDLQKFITEHVVLNKRLYNVFKEYADKVAPFENLSEARKYFISDTVNDWEKSGLALPDEQLKVVQNLLGELAELAQQFEVNIATDNRQIKVEEKDLKGVSEAFLKGLKREGDKFILGTDYPTYTTIMQDCAVASTRKALYLEFVNRAYPANKEVLEKVIAKRDQLAKMLNFESYSQMALDSLMSKNPEKAYNFLNELFKKAKPKAEQEQQEWLKELPESVTLTADDKIQPWDGAFIKSQYKKKHFKYNEEAISEYFPVENTINQLFDVYEKFFSLQFKISKSNDLWHDDLQVIEVFKDNNQIGYIILDLYPRPNKFTHACAISILPAVSINGHECPALCVVVANFPKSVDGKPALLKFNDVQTFFHEFGHAIHMLLGRTELYYFAGCEVEQDFVEMPSQMLENWIKDKEILKMISSHYKTGQSLTDDLIDVMSKLETFDSGSFISRQVGLALLSLDYYAEGAVKDLDKISDKIDELVAPHVAKVPDEHFWASFGHLMGYGPSYYGYLRSDVFAKDLFEQIKAQGLLNPEAGNKYAKAILMPGGSKEADQLLFDYLGRKPSQEAYLKAKGLK